MTEIKHTPKRSVWIHTFGCQMNVHDSERMLALLSEQGYSPAAGLEDANLVIFNSCSVREKAAHKLYSMLGELRERKTLDPSFRIGVGGCVAVTEAEKILKKNPHINFIFGTDTIDELPEVIHRLDHGEDHILVHQLDRKDVYSIETKLFWDKPQAYVNIQKGCDKFCTFCIVPFTRGREKSRRIEEIVQDVKGLVEKRKVKEVTLLGQTVNSFGKKNGERFSDLLIELNEIPGLELIRYTSPHPSDATDDLIECHKNLKKLAQHMHLPLQSGSNRILEAMNRTYTREEYLGIVERARRAVPTLSITTDLIVGFPGETDEDFEDTMEMLEKVRYDSVYSFIYSIRQGTKAIHFEDALSEKEKKQRLYRLQERQLEIQKEKNKSRIGEVHRVFVEGPSKNNPKVMTGRTGGNQVIHFETLRAAALIHQFVDLEVTSATALSLQGLLV